MGERDAVLGVPFYIIRPNRHKSSVARRVLAAYKTSARRAASLTYHELKWDEAELIPGATK
jgi:hypothetical protein